MENVKLQQIKNLQKRENIFKIYIIYLKDSFQNVEDARVYWFCVCERRKYKQIPEFSMISIPPPLSVPIFRYEVDGYEIFSFMQVTIH